MCGLSIALAAGSFGFKVSAQLALWVSRSTGCAYRHQLYGSALRLIASWICSTSRCVLRRFSDITSRHPATEFCYCAALTTPVTTAPTQSPGRIQQNGSTRPYNLHHRNSRLQNWGSKTICYILYHTIYHTVYHDTVYYTILDSRIVGPFFGSSQGSGKEDGARTILDLPDSYHPTTFMPTL